MVWKDFGVALAEETEVLFELAPKHRQSRSGAHVTEKAWSTCEREGDVITSKTCAGKTVKEAVGWKYKLQEDKRN